MAGSSAPSIVWVDSAVTTSLEDRLIASAPTSLYSWVASLGLNTRMRRLLRSVGALTCLLVVRKSLKPTSQTPSTRRPLAGKLLHSGPCSALPFSTLDATFAFGNR